MKRTIKKVAVLGSGVMGSRIACHFANIGLEVLLLDIVPREPNEKEAAKGLTTDDKAVRNRIVNDALAFAIKSNPNPLYNKAFASRITTGNFDDDMEKIADCDWTIEVVIERLDIKQQVFANVEKYRKPGTLITSNTSGIPIHMMLEGRSEDFQKHFAGTHFFNPPRYLKLLEIIPTPKTDPEVVDFLMDYGDRFLGKTTVLCKDTPAFIANRIGVYSIQALFHLVEEMGLSVTEVDKMTGPVLGRAKSATFRTCDVVGLDTLVLVAGGLKQNCPEDEANHLFDVPEYITKMVDNGWIGSKAGQGFFKKDVVDGKKVIKELNLETLEYQVPEKVKFATLAAAKQEDDLKKRMKILAGGKDKAGEFYRKAFYGLFEYSSNRIPEITDDLYKIDDAIGAGFGWKLGPFDTWDALGVADTVKAMEEAGRKPAQWVYDMLDKGIESFYAVKDGNKMYYDIPSGEYKVVPGTEDLIILDNLRDTNVVWSNSGTTLFDIGDGVLNLEFHTKMNTIGSEILQGLNKAIDIAEGDEKWKGLVIANEGDNFSAGANLGMIFMLAVEQEVEELDIAVKAFQDTVMRLRYSSIPVVAAPHGMALGGGCEICLHSDKVIAAAETYIGLVEFGAGVIPAGAGSKEMALRASDDYQKENLKLPALRERFLTVGMAKVATSAEEAFELGILRKGIDEVSVSAERRIGRAKRAVIELHEQGYSQPAERTDITVLGKKGLGIFVAGARSMESAKYISEHDRIISEEFGYVMAGGDLSSETKVSERYLLNLERKAFLKLAMTRKSMERMQSLITTGRPLRN
jgi:3-hydroxyacyl-CoA dehydrogenase